MKTHVSRQKQIVNNNQEQCLETSRIPNKQDLHLMQLEQGKKEDRKENKKQVK